MTQFKNAMEVFQLLDKSNCRKCNEPTCLAFAAAVFQGKRPLSHCPNLDAQITSQYSQSEKKGSKIDQDAQQAITNLQKSSTFMNTKRFQLSYPTFTMRVRCQSMFNSSFDDRV